MIEQDLQEARRALEAGDQGAARRTLVSVLREDGQHVSAWILLSQAVGTAQSAVWCLSRAVQIDPEHPEVLRVLDALRRQHEEVREHQREELLSENERLIARIREREDELASLESSVAQLRKDRRLLEEIQGSGDLSRVIEEAVQSGFDSFATSSEREEAGSAWLPRAVVIILVTLGILLLLVGTFLAYPHVASRLWWLPGFLGGAGGAPPRIAAQEAGASPTPPMASALQTEGTDSVPSTPRIPSELALLRDQPTTPSPSPSAASAPSAIAEIARWEGLRSQSSTETTTEATPTATATSPPAVPSRIVIPRLGLDAPVVSVGWSMTWVEGREMGVWNVPDQRAAGWHDESAPLGQVGNTVLNGHNTTYGEVFRDLYRLKLHDMITIYAGRQPYRYRVAETTIFREAGAPMDVRARHAELLGGTDNERLTLITCHPYGSTLNRLVITALPDVPLPAAERYGE